MDTINYNLIYNFFIIIFISSFIIFHIIVCGKKSSPKGKDTEQNIKISTSIDDSSSFTKNSNNRRIHNPALLLEKKAKNIRNNLTQKKYICKKIENRQKIESRQNIENKQKIIDSSEYFNNYKTQNQYAKNPDMDNKTCLSKTVSENVVDNQDVVFQDFDNHEKEKLKIENKHLALDSTQDHSDVEKTFSSYVSFNSTMPYIHKPIMNDNSSICAINNVSKLSKDLSTTTAYQKSDKIDIVKLPLKNKSENRNKRIFEDKNLKTAYEMPLTNTLSTRFQSTIGNRINYQEEKKNKSKDPVQSDYSFGSTVRDVGKKKEGKYTKGVFDNTETLPPPTSLQILQRHSNFELDDLTAKVRMMGEEPKLEEAIPFKDDDSILGALKLKQKILANKEKDLKIGNNGYAKYKEVSNNQTKLKEYPKPRKITEIYKNEELLKKLAHNKNNN